LAVSRFKYQGPVCSLSLRDGESVTDITLHPGKDYDLPADNSQVQAMVCNKFLSKVEAPAKPTRKSSKSTEEAAQ